MNVLLSNFNHFTLTNAMSTTLFTQITQPIEDELSAVHAVLTDIQSEVALVNDVSRHLLAQGGKRIRPILVIAAALCCQYRGEEHITLGAIVELIHAATLLHDDVIDNSSKRRHKRTANYIWDNKTSILAGDYVYALAFQRMTQLQRFDIIDTLAKATSFIVEGEILQLTQQNSYTVSLDEYYEVTERKTARLFSVSTYLGGLCANTSETSLKALNAFGHHFGMAYQMTNDVLDYEPKTGKNIGDDLAEGKPTLPFILAYKQASLTQKTILEKALLTGKGISEVIDIMQATHAFDQAYDAIQVHMDAALTQLLHLPDNHYRSLLSELCTYVHHNLKTVSPT